MRTLTTTMALGGIATLGLAVPAEAAPAADPAPTNVKVAWTDAAHTKVRVTWSEVGSVPNKVIAEYPGSNKGGSAPFDTLLGVKPVIDQISPVPPTKFKVRWHAVAAAADPNPGDPLDLPQAAPQYRVLANYPNVTVYDWVTPLSTALEATFEQWGPPPFKASVHSPNEWGSTYSQTLRIDYEDFTSLSIPSAVNYGQATVIKGELERWSQSCDPGPCWKDRYGEAPRLVVLQARANASSPWYVVGNTKSSATGIFSFAPVTSGTRQYRVVVPDVFDATGLGIGVTSGVVTTLAKPRVAGSFADPTIKYGQRATARVSIAPPANVRSTLQRWDGKVWRDLKWVTISRGSGLLHVHLHPAGSLRLSLPGPFVHLRGRPLSWQVSANFVLTS